MSNLKLLMVSILVLLTFTGCSQLNSVGLYTKQDLEREKQRLLDSERENQTSESIYEKDFDINLSKKFKCTSKNSVDYSIATGSKTGTYYQIGKDLSEIVAQDACINLKVLNSNGSIENVKRLAKEKGMKLAIVQSDVFQKFKDLAKTNELAKTVIKKLRVVKPLYFEEVHFIARKDLNIESVQGIKDLRINIGPKGSGTSMTTNNIYKELFNVSIPQENLFTFGYKEALRKLLKEDLDIVVYVAGQPTSRLDMPREAKNKIKLLKYDTQNSLKVNSYYETKINASSYRWLDKDVNTLAVKAYLITFDYRGTARKPLARFAKMLNMKHDKLQAMGHPKWKTVSKNLKSLPGGWKYYDHTKFAYEYTSEAQCSKYAKDLGLCK